MPEALTIIWFRDDLRISNHRALTHAAARGRVIPIYIYDNRIHLGGATKWWLHEALQELQQRLSHLGAPLILRHGQPEKIIPQIAKEYRAQEVVWSRAYCARQVEIDHAVGNNLRDCAISHQEFAGYLLFEPEAIKTGAGTPFKVYTPFSKACFAANAPEQPAPPPSNLIPVPDVASDDLRDWQLVPSKAAWPLELAKHWTVGEAGGRQRLRDFIHDDLSRYKTERDRPDLDLTSRLSPYLHFGHISPATAWHAAQNYAAHHPEDAAHVFRFQQELLWREFSWHLLHHFPHLTSEPMNGAFKNFPWHVDDNQLQRWQRGQTGYPIIDAGMRQLWQTGWMHNRVRMIVGSFLVKHLLIHWHEGMNWFWDTLVDADIGNNTASWQWIAGCGADAAPYFRVFNPILQSKKFDPNGNYIRRYVPELGKLAAPYVHEPWAAPPDILKTAGIEIGKDYHLPLIDCDAGRKRALEAYASLKIK